MTEQKEQILLSADFVKKNSPFKGKTDLAIITYRDPSFLKDYKAVKKIKYSDIPPVFGADADSGGELIYASTKNGRKNFYILNGHLNFYNGYKMREAAHPVYVLDALGLREALLLSAGLRVLAGAVLIRWA